MFTSHTSHSCHYQLRCSGSVHKYFTSEAAAKVVTSLILSRSGLHNPFLCSLHWLPVFTENTVRDRHILPQVCSRVWIHNPFLCSLHWLPVFRENTVRDRHTLLQVCPRVWIHNPFLCSLHWLPVFTENTVRDRHTLPQVCPRVCRFLVSVTGFISARYHAPSARPQTLSACKIPRPTLSILGHHHRQRSTR